MAVIVVAVTLYLAYTGYDYYQTTLEERFYHPRHDWFKPSGAYGHGLGIIGTLMIIVGVGLYIARKRYNFLGRFIRLKYLLEFHIFLCTLGPILVLFHTAFKFGGIVSIAFWSMVAVVLSGVVGRFIYIQIPRTIEGRALGLGEVQALRGSLVQNLRSTLAVEGAGGLPPWLMEDNRPPVGKMRSWLRSHGVGTAARQEALRMLREERTLSRRIARLETMQRLFKYWHVAHLPFALIMLVIVILHVGITLAFGYKWIF
ncbi:MAG: hypothetical protein D6722_12895 [Bacteroidetes bacterium]|nr:MAG: hypothetical protein D6722_12895 [Bacteroidota bacterium]